MDWAILVCIACIVPFTTPYKLYIGSTNPALTKDLASLINLRSARKSKDLTIFDKIKAIERIPSIESMLPKGWDPEHPQKFRHLKSRRELTGGYNVYPLQKPSEVENILRKISQRGTKFVVPTLSNRAFEKRDTRHDILLPQVYGEKPKENRDVPGDTLIQPRPNSLQSSAKYPNDETAAVYGNADSIGKLTQDGKHVLYTGFRSQALPVLRKSFDSSRNTIYQPHPYLNTHVSFKDINEIIKNDILNSVKQSWNRHGPSKRPYLVQVVLSPNDLVSSNLNYKPLQDYLRAPSQLTDKNSDESELSEEYLISRRADDKNCTDVAASAEESTSGEKNPGNPYTVWKNKYQQNWLWDHTMSGNHMNINPWAPVFSGVGPSASELFFGRKWWYFNQDDFKPFR